MLCYPKVCWWKTWEALLTVLWQELRSDKSQDRTLPSEIIGKIRGKFVAQHLIQQCATKEGREASVPGAVPAKR